MDLQTGNIVVTDWGNHRVQVFDERGAFLFMFGSRGSGESQFTGVKGVAVTEQGLIVVTDTNNHRVQVFNQRGEFVCLFGSKGDGDGQFERVSGVAVDPRSGNLITSDWRFCGIQLFQPNF